MPFKTRKQTRPRYNRKGWVLCECVNCGRHNYVEPHGTTAACKCVSHHATLTYFGVEHRPLPFIGGGF